MPKAIDTICNRLRPGRVLASESGLAVVMALAVVLIMATVALELHMNERSNMLNAAAMRDRQTLDQMATSGIHLAMAVLVKDRLDSEADSLQEDWADEETMAALVEQIPFDNGTLKVVISDELSKIQINALVQFPDQTRQYNTAQKQIWDRFTGDMVLLMELLEESGEEVPDTDAGTIRDSIKDWLDSGDDDLTELNGAETDYYEELDPPYACKNGPFDHLSEVRLVRGITPEIFEGFGGSAGLSQYITVYGEAKTEDDKFTYPGKININTAEQPVLAVLLPSESAEFADAMIAHREALSGTQYTNDLTNLNWYQNVPGRGDITLPAELYGVSSHVFLIVATAELNEVKATTTAVVSRERESNSSPWRCKVLNWMTE